LLLAPWLLSYKEPGSPLLHFDATVASCSFFSHRARPQTSLYLAEAFSPFSMLQDAGPFFLISSFEKTPERLALPSRSLALRVWLPAQRFRPTSLGSLFQLPTLLGFALQSFSPLQGSTDPFGPLSPLLHFLKKPLRAFSRCFSGLIPPEKPFPRLAPRRISSGQGLLLS
jgi:hypothetical protein